MTEEERHDSSVSRRTMLKRIGIAGAVAWVTPVVTSLNTPASAASAPAGTCSECSGDFCSGQTLCGSDSVCGCAQRVDGQGCFCYQDSLCLERTTCVTQSDCPTGEVCVHTCCDSSIGTTVCYPPCANPQQRPLTSSVAQSGTGLHR